MTGREEGKHPWFPATRKKGSMPVFKSPWFVRGQTWGARAGLYYTAGCPRITPPGLPTPPKPAPPPPPPTHEWPLLVVPGTARARAQVLAGLAEGRGTSELGPRASRRRLGRRGVEGSAHSWGRGRPECPATGLALLKGSPTTSPRVGLALPLPVGQVGSRIALSLALGFTGAGGRPKPGPGPIPFFLLSLFKTAGHRPQIPRTKQAPRATYADDLDARLRAFFFRFHKQDPGWRAFSTCRSQVRNGAPNPPEESLLLPACSASSPPPPNPTEKIHSSGKGGGGERGGVGGENKEHSLTQNTSA